VGRYGDQTILSPTVWDRSAARICFIALASSTYLREKVQPLLGRILLLTLPIVGGSFGKAFLVKQRGALSP